MPRFRRLVLLLAAAALVACGGPVVPTGITELHGSVYDPPGAVDPPQVLAVGMLLVDQAVAVAMTASSFAELDPGVFLGALSAVEDGEFAIPLPVEEDLPTGVLVDADEAVWGVADAGCSLTAEPSTAMATQIGLDFFPIPLLVGFTQDGIAPMLTTPTEIEEGVPYEGGYLSWMYADQPVALTTDDACVDYDVELELRQGWNQVIWTFEGMARMLRDASDEEAFSTLLGF